jgi:catechol-2,3-dioxygenase
MGRIILAVPDAKGLAEWLKTQGVDNRQVIAGVAYFINDPEGNVIELYTAPKP